MLRLFKDKRRLALLVLLAAIVSSFPALRSWLDSRSTVVGEPNAQGGLTYRDGNPNGIRAFPAPLGAVIRQQSEALYTDVTAETDATGELRAATIRGSFEGDLSRLIAFYAGPGRILPTEKATRRYSVSLVDLGPEASGRRAFRIAVSTL